MLVLTRKVGEKIVINDNVIVEVLEVRGGKVRLGLTAPPHIGIARSENRKDKDDEPGTDRATPRKAAQ